MALFYLIRHATADQTGRVISGRSPGHHLNEHGRQQAQGIARQWAHTRIERVFCSPLERTRETAEPLAGALGLQPQIAADLIEVDFGDWTERTLAELEPLEAWKQWNQFRSTLRIPNGETMPEVQTRMMRAIERLFREFPSGRLALVSHGDPIRTVIAHCLGLPLDFLMRFEISPASVSIVEINTWGPRVQCINVEVESLPESVSLGRWGKGKR